ASSHPSGRSKNLQILRGFPTVFQPLPLLTLQTIIREDKYAQPMHSYRKNGLYSRNDRPNLFRSVIRPIDRGGSVWRTWSNLWLGASPRSALCLRCPCVFLDSEGAAAARQTSPILSSVSIGSQN
ncbi:hypothetical protein FQN60_017276, partial [Xyrichtys novacula]